MILIKSYMNSGLANTVKKEQNFIVSMTDANSNKERELQDVGGKEIHCELLLDDTDVDLEIDAGS